MYPMVTRGTGRGNVIWDQVHKPLFYIWPITREQKVHQRHHESYQSLLHFYIQTTLQGTLCLNKNIQHVFFFFFLLKINLVEMHIYILINCIWLLTHTDRGSQVELLQTTRFFDVLCCCVEKIKPEPQALVQTQYYSLSESAVVLLVVEKWLQK